MRAPGEQKFQAGEVTFIGTATTLIRYGDITVLTDPNFIHAGERVHLGYGLFSTRITEPGMDIRDVLPLDVCVLSHFHGDHWDRVARDELPKSLPVVTTPHAARRLRRQGFALCRSLTTWESTTVRKHDTWLRITALPGRHGPALVHRLLPPVMGSLLEWGPTGQAATWRMYISGDTLTFHELLEIPRRYPRIDVALLHLGGTRMLGMLVTMDADQGVTAIRMLRPQVVIPIHYNDYPVFKSPLQEFLATLARARFETRAQYLRHGETYTFEVLPEQRQVA